MLDDRVRSLLARLEAEDARERRERVPQRERSRAIPPATGRLLFAIVASQTGCEVLELGGSRGYSTLWLAAAARMLGGHVTSIERDPRKCAAWRRNVADAGLDGWASLLEGDATEILDQLGDVFDVVFLDADKGDYEQLFLRARRLLEPGGVVVADNVLSHESTVRAYSSARQSDPDLVSVTVPLDHGLEISTVLRERV